MVKKLFSLLLVLLLAVSTSVFSQKLKNSRSSGYYTYIFRLNENEAERIVKKNKLRSEKKYFVTSPVGLPKATAAYFENFVDSIPTDSIYKYKPAPGYYLYAGINGTIVNFTFRAEYGISTKIIPHNRDLMVLVTGKNNKLISDASIFINNKAVPYDTAIKAYRLKDFHKQGMLEVKGGGEHAFYRLENYYYVPKKGLRKAVSLVLLPVKIVYGTVFCPVYTFNYLFKHRAKEYSYFGYMATNKPKYLPKDTVKMKAYVVDKKGRPSTRTFYLIVYGYDKSYNSIKVVNKELKPSAKGVYACDFVLGDSLTLNTTYYMYLAFNNKQWPKTLSNVSNSFYLEDYQLDETQYSFTTDKEYYNRGENIVATVNGADANGFPLKDSKVKVTAEVQWVDDFASKNIYVPKKLWEEETELLPTGNTTIVIPDSIFPTAVSLNVKLTALFNNSNNESSEIVKCVSIGSRRQSIELTLANDSLLVDTKGGDKDSKYTATVREYTYKDTMPAKTLVLPGRIKIDALANGYEVKLGMLKKYFRLSGESSLVEANNVRTADSVKVDMLNPRKIPVMYILYKGEKEIERGTVSGDFHWKQQDKSQSTYFIKYRYLWAGEVNEMNYEASVEDKKLTVNIKQPETIFPGEQTDVKVNVSDYKGQPAQDVNLTAVAVNAQFDRSNIPEVPYLDKSKKGLKGNNSFVIQTTNPNERYVLTNAWRKKSGVDSIPFYQVHYPTKGICYFYDSILSNNAQIAPFIVKNGYTVSIKMIWLDDTLIYYSPSDYMKRYSFVSSAGLHKLRLRTKDHEYTIDNVLLKKNCKLDLSLSLDSLPANVHAVKQPKKLSKQEVALLNNNLVYFDAHEAGTSWLWQGNRIYMYNGYYNNSYIGPFDTSKAISYYIRGNTGSVDYKHGYALKYDYDKKEVKLLKFDNNIHRINLRWQSGHSVFGDTAVTLEEIYRTPKSYYVPYSKLLPQDTGIQKGLGTLLFKFTSDSIISTIQLERPDGTTNGDYYGYCRVFYGLQPGVYKIYLMTHSGFTFCKSNVTVLADGVNCIEFSGDETMAKDQIPMNKNKQAKNAGIVQGQVTDYTTGDPVAFATVLLSSGYADQVYTTTDIYGHFSMAIPNRFYSNIYVSKTGYSGGYGWLNSDDAVITQNISMYKISFDKAKTHVDFAATNLDYYTYSTFCGNFGHYSPRFRLFWPRIFHRYREYCSAYDTKAYKKSYRLIGGEEDERNVRFEDGISNGRGDNMGISGGLISGSYGNIEGKLSLAEVSVKGTKNRFMSPLMDPEESKYDKNDLLATGNDKTGLDTASINAMLRQNAGNMFKNVRSNFSDYAYWNSNLFTDANGQATFKVKFPDNITQWASYVLAMDGNKHSGAGFVKTKAYNTINASLSMPRFLLPGDTAYVIGKSINLGKDSINIQTAFKLNDVLVKSKNALLVNSIIDNIPVSTKTEDSLTVQFSLLTTDGYSDGEKRVIPVFPIGVNESYGKFFILEKDTSLQVKMDPDSGKIEVFADGNYLNFLLHDIENLADYPYYCMEQTASKLSALLMKKNIYTVLEMKFHGDGEIHKLIKKLEKGQSDDGSFGWWPNTRVNIWMTSYILNILHQAQVNGYETKSLAKGIAFLEQWIGLVSVTESNYTTLDALNLLSEMKAQVDYNKYITRLKYADLDLTHKFMVIKILQENKLAFDMNEVLKEKKESMLGSMYWGTDKQSLYDNSIQASILAYKIFHNDSVYKKYLPNIRNYFFEKKYHGRWQNTVEAASILETILPDILKQVPGKLTPSTVTINSRTIKDFPYRSEIKDSTVKILKKGSSPVFITLYQTIWSKDEKSISKDFTVKTSFEVGNEKQTTLTAGQPTLLVADVELKKTAEYVMIEIPIPAGCSYGENDGKENAVEVHREYLKNKTNIFCENLKPGKYRFVIELQPRYTGSYTLNPAKAELMYFPIFFGREGIKKVRIK